jgi:hypothetical protein
MNRYIQQMYETYRHNVDLLKVLIGINYLLLKVLLVGVRLIKESL